MTNRVKNRPHRETKNVSGEAFFIGSAYWKNGCRYDFPRLGRPFSLRDHPSIDNKDNPSTVLRTVPLPYSHLR